MKPYNSFMSFSAHSPRTIDQQLAFNLNVIFPFLATASSIQFNSATTLTFQSTAYSTYAALLLNFFLPSSSTSANQFMTKLSQSFNSHCIHTSLAAG
jgi:hypothetical protein